MSWRGRWRRLLALPWFCRCRASRRHGTTDRPDLPALGYFDPGGVRSHDYRPDHRRGQGADKQYAGVGQSVNIYECADPDGQTDDLPTDGSSCDGLTSDNGATINVSGTGTIDKKGYEIFALPSSALGEPSNQSPVCTATSACVLYVGQNLNDFTQPYVWSTPFYVGATVGTPTPETPLTIGLPAAALLVLGGGTALTIRRRRRSAAA